MSNWDADTFNAEDQALIKFGENGLGSVQFGYVCGQIDYRTTHRDGMPAVEFSWEGADGADGTPFTGRGWAILDASTLNGMIFIHLGDDSDFVAKKGGK